MNYFLTSQRKMLYLCPFKVQPINMQLIDKSPAVQQPNKVNHLITVFKQFTEKCVFGLSGESVT